MFVSVEITKVMVQRDVENAYVRTGEVTYQDVQKQKNKEG